MQQGGGSHSHQFGHMGGGSGSASASAGPDHSQSQHSSQMVVEEASPISSRPPATTGSLDEFLPGSSGARYSDMDALASAAAAGEDADRGGGGSSSGGGNRWPRQETLALLRIRSEMDAAFRDATVKGPLWEDVSSKLAELGYKRSAKKCKEKFENVDKYYKRTKEGRAGRQDGKTYKFFSELEALHNTSAAQQAPPPPSMTATAANFPPGIGFSSPLPLSSVRPLQPTTSISPAPGPPQSHAFPAAGAPAFPGSPMELDFSSNSSSSSPETEDDEEDVEGSDLEGEPSNVGGSSRKRKRGGGSGRRMMEFFEGLMKQVMQKQEAMQQRFLEAIEKREQDRLIREEAWRRQETDRLAREHKIMAQERDVSASRDALIMSFLQKITGQTIQLPTTTPPAAATAPITPTQPLATLPQPIHVPVPPQQPLPSYQQQQKSQPQSSDRPPQVHQVNIEAARHQSPVVSRNVVLAAVPEQQVRAQDTGGGSSEPPSSRWPKTEVLALIKLRSGLESRYQEAGPKGPLWEEISAGMQRMGYRRSAKRCKEKWENINKYFKKVKESNKKRPEDAKTCPYFHELDALYRKKVLGGSSSGSIGGTSEGAGSGAQQVQHQTDAAGIGQQELRPTSQTVESETKGGGSSGQVAGNIEEAKKPEDTVKESIRRNVDHQQRNLDLQQQHTEKQHVSRPGAEEEDVMEEDEEEEDEDDDDEDEEEDEELQEERKLAYKIEFQQSSRQQNAAGPPNGGGSGAASATTSFMAMVQ